MVAGIAGATEQSPLASVTAATPGLQQPRETAPERGLEAHPLLKRPLWRENGARETLLYVIAARTCLPARKGRRSIGSRRDSVRERPFGVETAPKLGFPTGFRTREALRRRNGAEAWVPATLAARTGPRRQNLAGRPVVLTSLFPFSFFSGICDSSRRLRR